MPQPKDYSDQTDPNHRQRYFPSNTANSGGSRSGGTGSASFWLYLLQGLVLAGVLGLVAMTLKLQVNMAEVQTSLNNKVQQYDREFERVYKTLDRESDRGSRDSERITVLERQQREPQSYSHRR